MKIVKFVYDEKEVDFLPSGKDNNVMVNATQMANVFGKQVNEFASNKNTKAFINECLKNGNSRFLSVKNENDLIDSKQKSGTWMHKILALKFASWLDPKFELWVYITIDNIINQHFNEQRDAIIQKISLKQKKEDKKIELLKDYPKLAEYFDIENEEKEARKKGVKAVREQVKQLKFNFHEDKT